MPNTSLDREVERRLSERAIRYTRGRHAVVAALAAADGPLSAAELHETVEGSLPLSSIYRSLTVLEEVGVLAQHNSAKGLTRFELAEWLKGHHHHLICVECGSVEDVLVAAQHESQVDRIVDEISRAASFTPANHALEIEGRCSRCS
jgi:Fur family ferric uptake transcriptional regulator